MDNPAPIHSKLGPLPDDVLYEDITFDPNILNKTSPEMKNWLSNLVQRVKDANSQPSER